MTEREKIKRIESVLRNACFRTVPGSCFMNCYYCQAVELNKAGYCLPDEFAQTIFDSIERSLREYGTVHALNCLNDLRNLYLRKEED